jgi:hypothetical protein
LSRLIQKEIDNNQIHELKICRQSPGISHIFFADDRLLFFRADQEQALRVKNVMCNYEQATRQLLCLEKCSMLLGNKCT